MEPMWAWLSLLFFLITVAVVVDYRRRLRAAGASRRTVRASLAGAASFYSLPAICFLAAALSEPWVLALFAAAVAGTLLSFRLGGSPFSGTPTALDLERMQT